MQVRVCRHPPLRAPERSLRPPFPRHRRSGMPRAEPVLCPSNGSGRPAAGPPISSLLCPLRSVLDPTLEAPSRALRRAFAINCRCLCPPPITILSFAGPLRRALGPRRCGGPLQGLGGLPALRDGGRSGRRSWQRRSEGRRSELLSSGCHHGAARGRPSSQELFSCGEEVTMARSASW